MNTTENISETNIKELPDREYVTEIGYSQTYPYTVVRKTEKTITVAPVNVKPDPEWTDKMQAHIGGFAAHVSNQNEQTWIFDRIVLEAEITLRKNKHGSWVNKGRRFVENRAIHFYDYNF